MYEDQDKQITREVGWLAFLGIMVVLAFAFMAFGCGGDPTAPTAVVSPGPSPTPSLTCAQTGYLLFSPGFNADFHAGEFVTLTAVPSVGDNALDAVKCSDNYARSGRWSVAGGFCTFQGNEGSRTTDLKCHFAALDVRVQFCDSQDKCGARRYEVRP